MFHENEIQFRIQHVQLDQSKCTPYLLVLFEIIFLCRDVVKAIYQCKIGKYIKTYFQGTNGN